MNRLATAAVFLFLGMFSLTANAFPPDQSGKCLDCHKLEKKDAEAIIKKISPTANVLEVKDGPVKGFWLIEVEAGGQRGGILLDYTKKYLAKLTPLEAIIPKNTDFSKISLKDAILVGPRGAKKQVIVFTDPDCPFCRKLHEEIKKVVEKRKDIVFNLILFPLPMHKDAYRKSQAILCSKSLDMLNDAFAGKDVPEPKCGKEAVERNIALGKETGVTGTPTLVREDGTMVSGVLPEDQLIEWAEGK